MKLKKLHIQNYKSLVDLEIIEPNPFTVFAGPNGSGKSNIFEALEFVAYNRSLKSIDAENLFGGKDAIVNFNSNSSNYSVKYDFDGFSSYVNYSEENKESEEEYDKLNIDDYDVDLFFEYNGLKNDEKVRILGSIIKLFFRGHMRLFIKNESLNRIKFTSHKKLLPDASNLEAMLKIILPGKNKEEFSEWIELFVPGFERIEIHSDNISGRDTMLIYEKGTKKPFTKNLISDGTYNILCLLAAVYQSDEPQFLCIEEPENGLNPYVVESLVSFFRQQCEEKGHYIWVNTHSQTLVKELKPGELILVDKVRGETKIKQFGKDYNLHGLDMDNAWLSNGLGGGVPW